MIKKSLIALVVVLLAGGAFVFLRKSAPQKPDPWLGYVEGESLYIAAPVSGTLSARSVERGALVQQNAPLFALNPVTSDAESQRLAANLNQARAQLQNLKQNRQRPPEIAVSQSRQASAQAEFKRASKDYDRIAALARKGYATKARLDTAEATLQVARAARAQTAAEVQAGQISSGRRDEVRAAEAAVVAAQAALNGQMQRRQDIAPVAPDAGMIEQTFYAVGEWVPANAAVVALLPDNKRKIRFFVPETMIATLKIGAPVHMDCDACGNGGDATIRYIAPRAEFTPPVIYSERARAKLVFMVEAQLPNALRRLPVGLPVSVVVP
jgi:HlyD family secretion protein